MPIYEYYCSDCRNKFSALRSMAKADEPIRCEHCASEHTGRVLSTFYAHGSGGALPGAGGGDGCAGCGASSCAGCGHSHN